MVVDELVKKWLREGVINQTQATRMLDDVRAAAGIGQPDHRPDAAAARPKVGAAVMFLGALVNGLVLFVVTFAFDLDLAAHATLLLWMTCIIPTVYFLRVGSLAALLAILFCAWSVLFTFRDLDLFSSLDRLIQIPVIVLLAGLVLFSIGAVHYALPGFGNVARALRLAGIQAAMVALFALTLKDVARGISLFNELRDAAATAQVTSVLVLYASVAILATFAAIALRARAPQVTRMEAPITVALAVVAMLYVFVPLPAFAFAALFSAVMLALIFACLIAGYRRNDQRLWRIGAVSFLLFGALRYFDWAFRSLSTTSFLAAGLALLLVTGVGLEVIRRKAEQKGQPPLKV